MSGAPPRTLPLRPDLAAAGAVTAGAALVGIHLQVGSLLVTGAAATLATLVCYVIAARTMGRGRCEWMRGALLGVNAALNAVMAASLVGDAAGAVVGSGVGALLGAVTGSGVLVRFAHRPSCHALLGYGNWLLPSSWPVVALGVLFVGLSVALAPLGLRWRFFRILGLRLDAKTGTLFLHGGCVANLNYARTAFDMGPLAFVHEGSRSWHLAHEVGHSLNLAAFGSAFHLIGAWDENLGRAGSHAFAERLAESHVIGSHGPLLPMWRDPHVDEEGLERATNAAR